MVEQLEEEQGREVVGRQAEHPAELRGRRGGRQRLVACCGPAARATPASASSGSGWARCPSRNALKLPELGRVPRRGVARGVAGRRGDGRRSSRCRSSPNRCAAARSASPAPGSAALEAARAVVVQAVALHSPADLVVAAVGSPASARDWDWLKWVPHTASPHSPIDARHLASTGPASLSLRHRARGAHRQRARRPPTSADDPRARCRASSSRRGCPPDVPSSCSSSRTTPPSSAAGWSSSPSAAGSYGVARALGVARRPRPCPRPAAPSSSRARQPGDAVVGYVGEAVVRMPVDRRPRRRRADRRAARPPAGARSSTPASRSRTTATCPARCPSSTSSATELAEAPGAVIERWGENRSILTGPYAAGPVARPEAGQPARRRRAVGRTAPSRIDLRADGPHALVGGTTGAGKSEFLQAWILGMAVAHSPAAAHLPVRRLQGRLGLPRLRQPAAHRRPGHRPVAAPRPPRARLAVAPSCATASTSSPSTRPRTSPSSSAAARWPRRRAWSSSSTSSRRWSRRCPSSSTAWSTSRSAAARSGCT